MFKAKNRNTRNFASGVVTYHQQVTSRSKKPSDGRGWEGFPDDEFLNGTPIPGRGWGAFPDSFFDDMMRKYEGARPKQEPRGSSNFSDEPKREQFWEDSKDLEPNLEGQSLIPTFSRQSIKFRTSFNVQ